MTIENPNWESYWQATKLERRYQAKLSREGYRPAPGRIVVAVWAKDKPDGCREYLLWSNAELVTRKIVAQDTPGWSEGKRYSHYRDSLLKDIDQKLRDLGYHRNFVTDTETRRAIDKQGLRPNR